MNCVSFKKFQLYDLALHLFSNENVSYFVNKYTNVIVFVFLTVVLHFILQKFKNELKYDECPLSTHKSATPAILLYVSHVWLLIGGTKIQTNISVTFYYPLSKNNRDLVFSYSYDEIINFCFQKFKIWSVNS
jgi:hypothetical protein